MSGEAAREVQRRNEEAIGGKVLEAVSAALRDALGELAADRGPAYLDAFLERRLEVVESLRTARPGEPPGLAAARRRDAAAVEAALTSIVRAVRRAPPAGP